MVLVLVLVLVLLLLLLLLLVLTSLSCSNNERELSAMFRQIDADASGRVSCDEFLEFLMNARASGAAGDVGDTNCEAHGIKHGAIHRKGFESGHLSPAKDGSRSSGTLMRKAVGMKNVGDVKVSAERAHRMRGFRSIRRHGKADERTSGLATDELALALELHKVAVKQSVSQHGPGAGSPQMVMQLRKLGEGLYGSMSQGWVCIWDAQTLECKAQLSTAELEHPVVQNVVTAARCVDDDSEGEQDDDPDNDEAMFRARDASRGRVFDILTKSRDDLALTEKMIRDSDQVSRHSSLLEEVMVEEAETQLLRHREEIVNIMLEEEQFEADQAKERGEFQARRRVELNSADAPTIAAALQQSTYAAARSMDAASAQEVSAAIVHTRDLAQFKESNDLLRVPGITEQSLADLSTTFKVAAGVKQKVRKQEAEASVGGFHGSRTLSPRQAAHRTSMFSAITMWESRNVLAALVQNDIFRNYIVVLPLTPPERLGKQDWGRLKDAARPWGALELPRKEALPSAICCATVAGMVRCLLLLLLLLL